MASVKSNLKRIPFVENILLRIKKAVYPKPSPIQGTGNNMNINGTLKNVCCKIKFSIEIMIILCFIFIVVWN